MKGKEGDHMPYCYYAAQTAPQLQALAASSAVVAVLPIGAVEQHGPHLPVGTDFLSAQDITDLAMRRVQSDAQYLVLPPVIYGLSIEHLHVPGTITLMPETLIHLLTDIGESLLRLGVKTMAVVNGHGGNDSAVQIAGRLLRAKNMRIYMVDGGAIRSRIGAQEYDVHADEIETSVMMASHPEMVDTGRITPDLSASVEKWHQSADCLGDLTAAWFIDDISVEGVVGEPIRASADFGRTFMERQAEEIARALELAGELSRRVPT